MKKIIPLLISLGILATGAFVSPEFKSASASQNYEEVHLGPGTFNDNASEYSKENNHNFYTVSYRGDPENDNLKLMFFPNDIDYQGIAYNTPATASQLKDSDFSYIKVYTSETEYFTLEEIAKPSTVAFNVFADDKLNFAVSTSGMGLKAGDIYRVVVEAGFIYPHGTSDKYYYIQDDQQSLLSVLYGDSTAKELYFDWTIEKGTDYDEEEIIPVTAGYNTKDNYVVQIRDDADHSTPDGGWDFLAPDEHNCYILFLLPEDVYNTDIISSTNVAIKEEALAPYNMLDKIKCIPVGGTIDDALTLREVNEGKGTYFYNRWGERCSIAIKIGNKNVPDYPNYHANSFSSFVVEAGCEFPSYATTNGTATKLIKYVQTQTITFLAIGQPSQSWQTTFEIDFSLGDTAVEAVRASKETEVLDGESLAKTYVTLDLTNSEPYTEKTQCEFLTDDLLRKIFINGRALYYLNSGHKTYSFFNLEKPKTFSISIEGLEPEQIKEVIIKNGCPIPSNQNSELGMEIYKAVNNYTTKTTISYSLKNGEFVKDSYVTWTVWFDGANPVRVKHKSYFYLENMPEGQDTEFAKFVCWVDGDGNKLQGDFQVNSSMEFFSKYIYLHVVTKVLYEGKTETLTVEHNDRLTDMKDPKRSGYTFIKWVDESGKEFFKDNKVTRDITITAVWEKIESTDSSGCGGSLIASSTIISILSLMGVGVLFIKKKHS